MQLQMNSSFKKVQMLIPLWEQRPSGLTLLPPLAVSLPSGWSAAASAQPVPAFPEVAGFSLQSTTNKSNPNSHEQIRLRLFCPFIPVSKVAFRSTRSREYQKTHFSTGAEKERQKGDGVKGCTRVGRAGSEWQNNQNDTETNKNQERRRKTSPSPLSTCKETSQCLQGFPLRACCAAQCVNTARIPQ